MHPIISATQEKFINTSTEDKNNTINTTKNTLEKHTEYVLTFKSCLFANVKTGRFTSLLLLQTDSYASFDSSILPMSRESTTKITQLASA